MANDQEHQRRYKKLAGLADTYQQQMPAIYEDWEIVIRFYSAVHAIESYLINRYGRGSDSHPERNRRVRTEVVMKPFRPGFHRLFQMAWSVRYDAGYHATTDDLHSARTTHDEVGKTIDKLGLITSPRR